MSNAVYFSKGSYFCHDRWDGMELYDRRFQPVAERCPNDDEGAPSDQI